MKKLIETVNVNDILSGTDGIFFKIYTYDQTLTEPLFPWLTTDTAKMLDEHYYLSHSGDKWISKLFITMLKAEDDGNVSDALYEIAKMIHSKFGFTWNKIIDAWEKNYEPLENYDMEQTETPDITKTKAVDTNVTTTTTDDITANDIYGFNSSSAKPQTKSTRNGSVTTSGTSDDNIETETETGTRGLTRHGNIGVTTSQQMLQSEIDLRSNFNIMNQIMNDTDSILCLLVY